jgi:hypothetical protein
VASVLVAPQQAGHLLTERLPEAPSTGHTKRRTLTDTTTRLPSTGTSVTVRPWKPCTRPVGVPQTGHGTGSSRVRATTRTRSP